MPTTKPIENTEETISFADLQLRPPILQALTEAGYQNPTPIQQQTIPLLLEGRDVVGQAQTGTGKTAAFALPLLQQIDTAVHAIQALVLTPTRELAVQVAKAIDTYGKHLKRCSVLAIYGGESMQKQFSRLERGVHVVIATPGRLMDHMRRKSLNLDHVKMLVLDEADEMLRMGFLEDVTWILEQVPEKRQVALFSATMPAEVKSISKRYLKDPAHVHVRQSTVTKSSIDQRCISVSESHKWDVLVRLLESETMDATIIFTKTKLGASSLAERLEQRGMAVQALHSDLSQGQRQVVLQRLRDKRLDVVVATDVAARGLDIHHISHVINYDMPNDAETYVHRIGRTGRVSMSGIAILFVTPREKKTLKQIEMYTKQPIRPMPIPSLTDLGQQRTERLKTKIQKAAEQKGLEPYARLVDEWTAEGGMDLATLAAAALRLVQGDRPLHGSADQDPLHSLITAKEKDTDAGERPGRRSYGGGSSRQRPPRAGGYAPRGGGAGGGYRGNGGRSSAGRSGPPSRSSGGFEREPSSRDGAPPRSFGSGESRPRSFGSGDSRPRSFGSGESRPRSFGSGDSRPRSFGSGDSRPRSFGSGDAKPRGFGGKRPAPGGPPRSRKP